MHPRVQCPVGDTRLSRKEETGRPQSQGHHWALAPPGWLQPLSTQTTTRSAPRAPDRARKGHTHLPSHPRQGPSTCTRVEWATRGCPTPALRPRWGISSLSPPSLLPPQLTRGNQRHRALRKHASKPHSCPRSHYATSPPPRSSSGIPDRRPSQRTPLPVRSAQRPWRPSTPQSRNLTLEAKLNKTQRGHKTHGRARCRPGEPSSPLTMTQCSTAANFSETQNKIRTELLMQ